MKSNIVEIASKEYEKAIEIIKKLKDNGYDAYLVGGCVRDMLIGVEPDDYDVVTSADADEVANVFNLEEKDQIGKSFNVSLVNGIEVAGFRSDHWSDTDWKVKSVKTIEEDLARRDFTINAIAYDPINDVVIDPYGGRKDIKDRTIRFVGDAESRIFEDPIRIIRAFRFRAKNSFIVDSKSSIAIIKLKSHLNRVPKERVQKEIIKAADNLNFDKFMADLRRHGACWLTDIVKDVDGGKYHDETVICHCEEVCNCLRNQKPLLKLAGLFHDVGKCMYHGEDHFIGHEKWSVKFTEQWMKEMKFSSNDIKYVTMLIKHHMRPLNREIGPKGIRKMLASFERDGVDWRDWMRLKIADRKANFAADNYTIGQIKNFVKKVYKEAYPKDHKLITSIKDLTVNGNDVMNTLGVVGKDVGEWLRWCLGVVLENPKLNDKLILTKKIEEEYKRQQYQDFLSSMR